MVTPKWETEADEGLRDGGADETQETQVKRVLKLRSIDPIVFCKFSGGAFLC